MADTPINLPHPATVPIGVVRNGLVYLDQRWYQGVFLPMLRRMGGESTYVISDLAGLTATDGGVIIGDGANFVVESGATARQSLGLVIGTDVQAFDQNLKDIADLVDPNADRILFWDDSAGAFKFLTVGTNLTLTDTTITASGGGGGSDPIADIFGTADTAYEFDTSSLTGLTGVGSPNTENADTTVPGHFYIKDVSATYDWCLRYQAPPSTPYTAITKVFALPSSSFNKAGIFIGVSPPGNMDVIYFGFVTSARTIRTERVTPTAFGSSINTGITLNEAASSAYLAIRVNSSSDVDYLYSLDGRIWKFITEARNPSITIGAIGIGAQSDSSSVPVAAAFDYFRIWNSALTFGGAD